MSALPNQTNLNPTTSFFALAGSGGGGGGGGTNLFSTLSVTQTASIANLTGVSSITGVVNPPSGSVNFIDFQFRPQTTVGGDKGTITIFGKADDNPGSIQLDMGVDVNDAECYIASSWPGYIYMPMRIQVAELTLKDGDGTPSLYMNSAGVLSTGVSLVSQTNVLGTVTDPLSNRTANIPALWSTLASLYPSNFS